MIKKMAFVLVLVVGVAVAMAAGNTTTDTSTTYDLTDANKTAIDARDCDELNVFWDKAKGNATNEFIEYFVKAKTAKGCEQSKSSKT